MTEKGLSLKPSEMSAGGGLWGDIRATITGSRFEMSTYGGSVPVAVPAYILEVKEEDGTEHDQIISCGRGKFTPSADGKRMTGDSQLNVGSNFGLFITSLIINGFPEDRFEDDVSILIGLDAHFGRVAAPERKGLQKQPRKDGRQYDETVLNVTKVFKLPWEKGKAKAPAGAAKAPAAKGAAQAPVAGGNDATTAGEAIMAVLLEGMADHPDGMSKAQLVSGVIKKVATNPNKAKIVAMVLKDDFLSGVEGVAYDGATAQIIL